MTQQEAAKTLRVSQPYLALLESGRRPVTARLGTKIANLYGLDPVALPVDASNVDGWDSSSLAAAIASLGYPGFSQLAGAPAHNPASILLAAVTSGDLEVRIGEALPWVALEYSDLDWEWLVREAKVRNVQNRLGFVVTLARQVAEKRGPAAAAGRLRETEEILDRSRLVREDTLAQESLSDAERQWLRQSRPAEAVHWNLLTDLHTGILRYAP
ncbi:MAG: helix-turn-helix transcriptional regulator [Bryobacteraceae bacterium]|nr:helix-turn-helix transcriptional regulator [Bryobacteraceae bacterium]